MLEIVLSTDAVIYRVYGEDAVPTPPEGGVKETMSIAEWDAAAEKLERAPKGDKPKGGKR